MNNKKLTVLVIDDDRDVCDLVSRILLGTEFQVLQAFNGREGIQTAKDHKPDIILLDIMMPNFDGFMTGKIFKRNITTRDIPIIFLSGKKSRQDINAAIQAGGSDYIIKPFSPSDLLTRIRRAVTVKETLGSRKKKKDETPATHEESVKEKPEPKIRDISKINIIKYGVLDTKSIEIIDGAGLALLVSVNESLKSYGGELRITFPNSKVNKQLSYVKMNELFRGYDTIQNAVESFHEIDSSEEIKADHTALNLCIMCTYVNDADARYCAFCGTNLVMGRGENILNVLRSVISHRIVTEAHSIDTQEINTSRNINTEEYDIPSEFNVELYGDNFVLNYKSNRTVRKYYESNKLIGILSPVLYGVGIPLPLNMKLQLSGTQSGAFSSFETEIKRVDEKNGIIYVHYPDDAKVILSQKNFSIAPNLPIPFTLINPSFGNTGKIINGKILELSSVRMVVFSEDRLPEDECLSVNFILPDEHEISSPLVIAKKRRERFMYTIEFVVIDETERSRIIQYMYKRQIELAKG